MNLGTAFVVDAQPAIPMQPTMGPLYPPTVAPQALRGRLAATCNARRHAALTWPAPIAGVVLALVRKQLVGTTARVPRLPSDQGQSIDQRAQPLGVMHVGAGDTTSGRPR